MKVLIACEFSGTVRDAFIALGHEAMSCDLLPTERPGPHYQGDVRDVIGDGWDLVIAHPPCTYLCASGMHWTTRGLRDQKRTDKAVEFFLEFTRLQDCAWAIENPVGCMSRIFRQPDQIIQPWMFGHPESKTTCLWLQNLPALVPTNVLSKPASGRWNNQTPSGQNKLGPSADRWAKRSKTYVGIAEAMAAQWGAIC